MMVQENEALAVKVARLEERQFAQEGKIVKAEESADYALQVAEEAKGMIAKTNEIVAGLPSAVIDAMEAKSRQKGLDRNQWMVLIVAVASVVVPIITKAIGG